MEGENKNLKYWVAFSQSPNLGPKRFSCLRNYFPNLEEAWNAPFGELKKSGLEEKTIREILELRKTTNPETEMEKLEKEKVFAITLENKNYPKLLKEIYYPPPLLYYRGKLPSEHEYLLAVVGTRKFSKYGQLVAQSLVYDLSKNGLTIVSGLALGIDSLAHKTSIEAGGKTIAILGCGIEKNNVYPVSNRNLAEKIIQQQGCIISEHPLGMPPLKHHFPRRNRLISGLSLGTLVIEAPKKSGSLITAMHALEQNREVFAVPANITSPNAGGVNELIKNGARVVDSYQDVLECLNLQKINPVKNIHKIIGDTPEENLIIDNLKQNPTHINELIRLTKINASSINSTLAIMEVKGKIKNLGGSLYVVNK